MTSILGCEGVHVVENDGCANMGNGATLKLNSDSRDVDERVQLISGGCWPDLTRYSMDLVLHANVHLIGANEGV